jgi:hypothetical protein
MRAANIEKSIETGSAAAASCLGKAPAEWQHPDPVHNVPEPDERALLAFWAELDKERRYRLVSLALAAPHAESLNLAFVGEPGPEVTGFLRRALCFRREQPPC